MLKKYFTAILAMAITLVGCSAQSRLIRDLPTGEGATKVVLSGAMMKLAKQYAMGTDERYGELFKEIKSLEIYTSENSKLSAQASRVFNDALPSLNAEPAVMVEEDGEISNIYTISAPGNPEPEGIIVYNYEKEEGELNIVIIKGKMDSTNLANIAK